MSALIGPTGRPGTCPAAAASIPSHIEGATAGSAKRFAASVVVETAPKWKAISGAVASVAAIVRAAPSATAPPMPPEPIRIAIARRSGAARSRIPTTAAKLSCQPTSAAIRGSTARVTIAATANP